MPVVVAVTAMLVVVTMVLVVVVPTAAIVTTVMVTVMVVIITIIMRRVIVRTVAMRIVDRVRVTTALIGAAFGIERRLDLDHPSAKALHHLLDHVITSYSQSPLHDLRRQMAVAEMPADANKMLRVLAADFNKRLRCRHDLNQPAVLKHQRVAAAQCDRLLEIQHELDPARAGHRHPPPVPIVEVEHDRIGRRLAPAMVRLDLGRADHSQRPR